MYYSFVAIAVLLLLSVEAQSQATGQLKGSVSSTRQQPLEGALVALYRVTDTVFVKSVLSEADGKFELNNLTATAYRIKIAALGYLDTTIEVQATTPSLELPKIQLRKRSETELKAVQVIAQTPFAVKKIDRIVVNPDALIGNAGSTAMEVLEKSPGVQVDLNGVISLRGKQGVLVYIDDKPTYLSEADLSNYLKAIPASSIASIELMTNPPAKYDAAGNAGVIVIRLKKLKAKGWNGSLSGSYGQGFYPRTNWGLNFNYRINKFNFFSNFGYMVNNSYQDLTIKRNYFTSNGQLSSSFNQQTFIKNFLTNGSGRIGLDYYHSKRTTFGMILSGFDNIKTGPSVNEAYSRDPNGMQLARVEAVGPNKRVFINGSVNLNANVKLDTLGSELALNADYAVYNSAMKQALISRNYDALNNFSSGSTLISTLPAQLTIQSAQADYTHPWKKGGRLEAGLKSSRVQTSNTANFFDQVNDKLTVNTLFSNQFNYQEQINAAYLNYNFEHKKWSLQTGLRVEQTAILGHQLGNSAHADSTFKRSYTNAFPTFYWSYQLDSLGNHLIGISYGRRIERPNYEDMNPFTYPLDRFTLYAGNPFLRPTFANVLELTYTYKNAITFALSYSHNKDLVSETIEQNNAIFYSRPGNIGQHSGIGFSVNGSIPIKKWWTLQLYTELTYNKYQASLYQQQLINKGPYWYIGPVSQFQLPKSWSLEVAGMYQTKVPYSQFILISNWNVRAGVAKRFWKNKAALKLNVGDIFYSNQPGGTIIGINQSTASWHSYLDSRVVTLAFSYRFTNGQTLAVRESKASTDEKNRVK